MSVGGMALKISLPDAERGLSADDIKEFDRISARLARNTYRSTSESSATEKRDADLKRRDDIVHRRRFRADQAWRHESASETEALAEARGEVVETQGSGVKRIVDRDPILSLFRAGKLTVEQMDTGLEVRALYDARAADAGAVEYTGMPGSAHDHERFVSMRFVRAKASAKIGKIEREMAIECSAEPACLTMLRVVCERGHPISSQGKGRALDRNAAALARALDVAEAVLRRRL